MAYTGIRNLWYVVVPPFSSAEKPSRYWKTAAPVETTVTSGHHCDGGAQSEHGCLEHERIASAWRRVDVARADSAGGDAYDDGVDEDTPFSVEPWPQTPKLVATSDRAHS